MKRPSVIDLKSKTNRREIAASPVDSALANDGAAILFLCAIAAAYFGPVLIYGNQRILSSVDGDTWSQFFYWRKFAFESLARGELPLWNPYNFSGQPFVGAMQSAIFYPPNLLFLLFDTPLALNLSVALHCFGASIFTYLFARYIGLSPLGAVLSGVTFAYSAPYFLHIYPGHLPHLAAMWMPLMFLGMEAFLRHGKYNYAVWAAMSFAMQILAGYPQYSFYCGLAVSLYYGIHWIVRKDRSLSMRRLVAGYAIFVGGAVLLSAVQLAPAWEFVRNSARGAANFEWISIFSLPPENLLTLLFPNLFGDMVNVPYWGKNNLWEMSVYIGVIAVVMSVVAVSVNRDRQIAVLTGIGAGFLILALGKNTPLVWLLYSFVPGFSLFRGVGKAAFVFAFCMSLVAGFGLESLHRWMEKKDKRLFGLALLLVVVAVVLVGMAFLSPAGDPQVWSATVRRYASTDEHFEPLLLNESFFRSARYLFWSDVAKVVVVLLALAGVFFAASKAPARVRAILTLAVLILAVGDLWHFGDRFLISFDAKSLSIDPELKSFFKAEQDPYRIATPLARLRNNLLNAGLLEGIENVGGYDAIVVKSYSQFVNLSQGLPLDYPNLLMGINRISPLLNLLNVKYYLVEPSINIDLRGFRLVFENSRHRVYRSQDTLPRSFVAHGMIIAASGEDALRQLTDPGFDPTLTVVLDEVVTGFAPNAQQRSPLPRVVEHAPKRVIIDAVLSAPGMLVLADSYYPGWKALIGGKEVKIYRANHVMRAVFLPAGRHRVEFYYDPFSFKIGAAISGAAAMVILGVLFTGWARSRANHRSADDRSSPAAPAPGAT